VFACFSTALWTNLLGFVPTPDTRTFLPILSSQAGCKSWIEERQSKCAPRLSKSDHSLYAKAPPDFSAYALILEDVETQRLVSNGKPDLRLRRGESSPFSSSSESLSSPLPMCASAAKGGLLSPSSSKNVFAQGCENRSTAATSGYLDASVPTCPPVFSDLSLYVSPNPQALPFIDYNKGERSVCVQRDSYTGRSNGAHSTSTSSTVTAKMSAKMPRCRHPPSSSFVQSSDESGPPSQQRGRTGETTKRSSTVIMSPGPGDVSARGGDLGTGAGGPTTSEGTRKGGGVEFIITAGKASTTASGSRAKDGSTSRCKFPNVSVLFHRDLLYKLVISLTLENFW
jgi:hypothetical protein